MVCKALVAHLFTPSALALIISVFSGEAESKAIGTWTAWISIATVSGPIAGGLILAVTTWRWIFIVSAIPIAITLWLLMRVEGLDEVRHDAKVDVIGAVLCALGLGLPVFAFIEQPTLGWSDILVWLPLAVGAIAMTGFIWHEKRVVQPMLPLSLFKIRNFSAGNVATLAVYAGLTISTFLLTITLQEVGGYSAYSGRPKLLNHIRSLFPV